LPIQELFFFAALLLPFGVKLAFFPPHSGLPEAPVEASTEGSMLLSGGLLKLVFFGIFFLMPICGNIFWLTAPFVLATALVGAALTAASSYRQPDLKKVIAYSSVVHMNLALCGYFVFSPVALQGALFLNLSHGIISAGLFSAVGLLQERNSSRSLLELSGLGLSMPS